MVAIFHPQGTVADKCKRAACIDRRCKYRNALHRKTDAKGKRCKYRNVLQLEKRAAHRKTYAKRKRYKRAANKKTNAKRKLYIFCHTTEVLQASRGSAELPPERQADRP